MNRRTITGMVALASLIAAAALFPVPVASDKNVAASVGTPAFAGTVGAACGSNLSSAEVQAYLEMLAQGIPDLSPTSPPPYCVPIAGHIVRRSNGTGGMSLDRYYQSVEDANFYFASSDIKFYTQSVDFIDSDFFYLNISGIGDINALRSTNVIPNAINVYYTPNLPGLCGISSFTFSSTQGIVMANGCSGVPDNPTTMPHEIGHYFDLFHTHETAFGIEFVDGTNCGFAGDQLCDTPADPTLGFGNVTFPGCVYFGTQTDPHGDRYTPDPSQIMSYAPPLCANNFSPQSRTKAVQTLVNLRPALIAPGCNPFGAPVVTQALPPGSYISRTLDVTVVGSNLGAFTVVDLGADITINSTSTLSPESLVVNITIAIDAAEGYRDLIAVNAFDSTTAPAAFQVIPTPIHYASPAGENLFPYANPGDAATSLGDALSAATGGDTVLVDSTAIAVTSVSIIKPIVVSGGWTDNFTARNLPATRTHVTLGVDAVIGADGGTAGIEGFALHDGAGAIDVVPEPGKYGGGLRVINSNAIIRDCEIYNCVANTSGFGGGGGISASNSSVLIEDCEIYGNLATRGGGIFLYNCTGTISDVTVQGNTTQIGGAIQPTGSGIALQSCPDIAIVNTTIDGNTSAQSGGGLWASGSTVTIDGGTISTNTSTFAGGGISVLSSTISLNGTDIVGNSSLLGGGIHADSTITATTGSTIENNSATIGAGVYANSGTANLRHSLYRMNTAVSSGGGMYISGSGGEVAGNTLEGNSGSSAGMYLLNGTLDVFNNIVANSIGHGISCLGGSTNLSYNLVFGSSGSDYDGCAPGMGSVNGDPLFADTPGSDYHLTINSPAIDAGDPAPAWNDPDGGRGDMGWYGSHAFVMERPTYPAGIGLSSPGGDLVLTWNRNPEGSVAYYAVYCDTLSGFVPGAGTLVTTTADTTQSLGPAPPDTTWYVVCAVDTNGYAGGYSDEEPSVPGTASSIGPVAWLRDSLDQNVPNPFNPTTTIRFSTAAPGLITLSIYDVSGRRIRTLINESRPADQHQAVWRGTNDAGVAVASGVYFYRLETSRFAQTRKMVLLK